MCPLWAFLTKYMMDRRFDRTKGFGLIELMITLVILALLVSIAVPAYEGYTQRARVTRSIGDIGSISLEIERFQLREQQRASRRPGRTWH